MFRTHRGTLRRGPSLTPPRRYALISIEVATRIDDHHLALLDWLTLMGDGGRLDDRRTSSKARYDQLPVVPSELGTEVPCPRHWRSYAAGIVLQSHFGTENKGVGKLIGPSNWWPTCSRRSQPPPQDHAQGLRGGRSGHTPSTRRIVEPCSCESSRSYARSSLLPARM